VTAAGAGDCDGGRTTDWRRAGGVDRRIKCPGPDTSTISVSESPISRLLKEIEKSFERFQQGAVRGYGISYRAWPGMNHVGAKILELVSRLFREEFTAL
jgi:hypothetical protein